MVQGTRPARGDVRDAVLHAARSVFGELGYHRASLDLIASRAGFSKGAVYSNFAGKDDLFLVLLADEVAALGGRLGDGAEGAGLERLAADLLSEALDGRAQLVFAEFRSSAARDEALARRLAAVRDQLVDVIADRLEREVSALGTTLAVEPHEAATVVVALVNGLALEHVGHVHPIVSASTLARVLRSLTLDAPRESS